LRAPFQQTLRDDGQWEAERSHASDEPSRERSGKRGER
jgi:hypothetical protein